VSARNRLNENAECCLDPDPADWRQPRLGAVAGDEIWKPHVRIVIGPMPFARHLELPALQYSICAAPCDPADTILEL
jgi:hypothetical protein